MSDLSKVLGDLYGGDEEPVMSSPAPRSYEPTAPAWADEDRLDEAFSSWTPGPPAEAPAAEREMSQLVIDTPAVPSARLDEDLAATLSAALVDAGHDNGDPEVPVAAAPAYSLPGYAEDTAVAPLAPLAPMPVEAPEYVEEDLHVEAFGTVEQPAPTRNDPMRPWSRLDDDIFPGKSTGPQTKAPKVKATKGKAPKAAKAPKAPKAAKGKAPKEKAHKLKAPKVPMPESAVATDRKPVKVFGITIRK